jgi:hypothetical protein
MHSVIHLGLVTLSLLNGLHALPIDEFSISVPSDNDTHILVRHANGVEERAAATIEKDLLDKFIYFSQYNAAAYCPAQQNKIGGKISCGKENVCPIVQKGDNIIHTTWKDVGSSGATGFVASDHSRKVNVLTLRGSVSMANWIADAKFVISLPSI